MTIRHIRIFEALCRNDCNMTRTAEELSLSQPAVSLSISELESYYGLRFFDRIGRRLILNGAGVRFLDYCRTITHTFDDMERTVRNWESSGVIRAGASISIGSMLMPEWVSQFRKTHPDTTVRVKIDRSDRLENALLDNSLDFALIEGIVHHPHLISENYMEDRLSVITSVNFHENGATISPDEFLRMDFLLREHGSGTREVFETALSAASLPLPEPIWESLSTAALMNAAAAGLGAAVVPRRMAKERIERGEVHEIFVEGVDFRREYKIVFHKDKQLAASARAFLDLCRAASNG